MPIILDIAKRAGFALIKVSHVINDRSDISQEIIEELGYRLGVMARSLIFVCSGFILTLSAQESLPRPGS